MTLDQSILQFTEAASGIETPRLIAQSFPSEENPEGKVVIANEAEWPENVLAAVEILKQYSQTLFGQ